MNPPKRFYSLDVLRGIAAFSVVFWHWQHFFYFGTELGKFTLARLPFFEWISILYTKGWLAVDLFFCLSGFVFYWLYSRRVAEGAISPGRFALLRFSRLYPLHFATLLFVAAGQIWLIYTRGLHFVNSNNDYEHFLLNLFFVSSWGMEHGISFNGPAWSVSVEVFLYVLFFVCCRLLPIRPVVLVFFSLGGFVIVREFYSPIGRGIGSFFLGGCVFLAYQAIVASRGVKAVAKWVAYITVGVWVATLVVTLHGSSCDACFQWNFQKAAETWPAVVLFPLTILALALNETCRGPFGKRISFLGDISYSSYLLQFPLQLLFSVAMSWLAMDESVYYSPWFMGLFFAVLIAVSLGSFRYFEVPAQRYLRQTGLTGRVS